MDRVERRTIATFACVLALALVEPTDGLTWQLVPGTVPIPQVTGPIPVTADSYPQLAASRTQTPMDLAASGYVEEEFLVSGAANVYNWAEDGTLRVATANAPYTTRILVRRPSSPSRFSGNVVVETVNNARQYDWAFIWPLSYQYFMERGDVYVAVTHTPQAIAALQKFDPERYGSLSFANPTPELTCGPQGARSDSEEGLRWDMISQVGSLLKSGAGPLAGFDVQYLYATTHTRELITYINSVHRYAKLPDGKPVYDGFVVKSEYAPADRISRCATTPDNGDPRQIVHDAGVPVIRVTAQGDVLATYGVRREDSDDPDDPYRLWEVAGAPHMDKIYYEHMPVVEDQVRSGQTGFLANWPMAYACTPDIDLLDFPIMRYTMDAAFAAVDEWARHGIPAPRAERIGVRNGGSPQATLVEDRWGNATGGVRSVFLDVPAATYRSNSTGPAVCNNLGQKVPFSWARMESLYGSSANYRAKVSTALDELVSQRWITPADSQKIRDNVNQWAGGPE